MSLLMLILALVFGAYAWWDWQDGSTNTLVTFVPVWMGVMGLALLIFPGAPLSFREAALDSANPNRVGDWLGEAPAAHKRAWLAAMLLAIYLSFWLNDYLESKAFFTFGTQLGMAAVVVGGYFFLRRYARRRGL